MSSRTIELLSSSYAEAAQQPGQVARRFYQHFFAAAPDTAELFDGVDMALQGQMVLQAVGLVVKGMERPDELASILDGLGYRHLRYGAEPELYAAAARAFCDALRDVLGEGFSGPVEAAWLPAANRPIPVRRVRWAGLVTRTPPGASSSIRGSQSA